MSNSITPTVPEVEPRVTRSADTHVFPLSSRPEPFFSAVVIRLATAADRPRLERLAQLDSARALEGETLIGEVRGQPVVALALTDGRSIADPFVATSPLLELVRLRARQISSDTN